MKVKSTERERPTWCPEDLVVPAILHQLSARVVDGRSEMAAIECGKLRETIRRGARRLVFVDGPPGTGKSGMTDRIADKAVNDGILPRENVLRLPLDCFSWRYY